MAESKPNIEGKRWLVHGKPFVCPFCGWVLKQAASNNDIKRGIVCPCPDPPFDFPKGLPGKKPA